MTSSGHILTAQSRIRNLRARIAFSLLNFAVALYLNPSPWLALWVGVSILAQMIDCQLFANALAKSRRGAFKRDQVKLIVSIVVVACLFDTMIVYDWVYGGETGEIVAILGMVCTLLHVLFTLYYMRRYMFAAFTPHAICLIALPVYSIVTGPAGQAGPMVVVLIILMFLLGYFAKGVREFNKTLRSHNAARASAQKARRVAVHALNAKFNFLATVSHEIRTPMNAVVSSVHLLRQTGLTKAQSEHVNLLEQSSEILLGLLNDVLDLSKLESGKMKIETAPINLHEIAEAQSQIWLPQTRAKGIGLRIEFDPDMSPLILGDALRLKQILFNLLSNAVKFTHKGEITLRIRQISDSEGDWRLFEVEDQGIGIEADMLDKIFLSFEQADASTTRRYGGTGLGLTISQRLARLMGGDVTATSTPGVGSRFVLKLPYWPVRLENAPREIPEVAQPVEPKPPKDRLHVLIVDDHEVNRRIVSLFIAPLEWSWVMATDGLEAVRLCETETFDVILMDMQMPGMNGIEATRTIRSHPGLNQHTPIIALTANGKDTHGAAWAEVGVHELITKPLEPEKLISAIWETCQGDVSGGVASRREPMSQSNA